MDIDELKDETKKTKAPDLGSLDFGDRVRTVDGLVDELKRRDAAEKGRLRRMMIVFSLCGALIALAAFTGYVDPGVRLGRTLIVILYGLIVATAAVKLFGLARVDYSESALAFLRSTERRYRFIAPWEYAYIVPGLAAAALAGWLILASGYDMLIRPGRALRFNVLYALGFCALCAFGFAASKKNWKRDKGPLHDRLARILEDFSEDV